MGTRADFYIGRGEEAEWLGSIAWDGYPGGVFSNLIGDSSSLLEDFADENHWRSSVEAWFAQRDDATLPAQGWPWPWEDSQTTDYAYAFDGGEVWGSCFGHAWFKVKDGEPDDDDEAEEYITDGVYDHKKWTEAHPKSATFPNMKERQKVTYGSRSGVMLVGPGGPVDKVTIDQQEAEGTFR